LLDVNGMMSACMVIHDGLFMAYHGRLAQTVRPKICPQTTFIFVVRARRVFQDEMTRVCGSGNLSCWTRRSGPAGCRSLVGQAFVNPTDVSTLKSLLRDHNLLHQVHFPLGRRFECSPQYCKDLTYCALSYALTILSLLPKAPLSMHVVSL